MAENDFDIDSLAKYLHITPQQVEKLASRGKVPARRVSGEWVFNSSEIHHWMEERMGLLEDSELARVETAMSPIDWPRFRKLTTSAPKSCTAPMKIDPNNTQHNAGIQPHMMAIAGPTIGPVPAMLVK